MRVIRGLFPCLFPHRSVPIERLRLGAIVTVRGRVVPRDLIECPLTGQPGVYYHYAVEDWRRSHMAGIGTGGFWELGERDEAIAEFYIDDGSGRALVSPHRARVDRAPGVAPRPIDLGIFGRRAHELVIGPGDLVEVTALVAGAHDLFDEGRGYRTSPWRLCLCAPPTGPIRIRALSDTLIA